MLQDAKRSASYLSAARINGVQWTSDMILDFHTACATALKCYPYKKGATWHAAVKSYLAAPDEDERGLIEFEWNLRGAVQNAYDRFSKTSR